MMTGLIFAVLQRILRGLGPPLPDPPVEMYRSLCPLCGQRDDHSNWQTALSRTSAHIAVDHAPDREPR